MAERERRTQELLKSCEASAANRKRAVRSTWSIGMNKALAQNVSHEKVRLFGEAFAKIQEATGVLEYLTPFAMLSPWKEALTAVAAAVIACTCCAGLILEQWVGGNS
jgi:hypothetical protein